MRLARGRGCRTAVILMPQDDPQKQANIKKHNHTIPRMLLKRFASRSTVKSYYIWQFRQRATPFESNILRSSTIAYFYGEPANGVEDSFSVVESQQSIMLDKLLDGIDPRELDDELRRFVWMLAIRTANFRSNVKQIFSGGIDEMITQADDETITRWLPKLLDAEFDTVLDELVMKLPPVQARALKISLERRPSLRDKLRQWADIYLGTADTAGNIQAILSAIREQMDTAKFTGDAHVKSIEQLPQIDHAPDSFRPAHWHVIRTASQSVLLGDGTCFAVGTSGEQGHLLRFAKDWHEIYLPIAHNTVLVASRSAQRPLYSIEDINQASASLSFDQFFAARNTDYERSLQAFIRTGTATMTTDEIQQSVRAIWSGG